MVAATLNTNQFNITSDKVYRDAALAARSCSVDALLALADVFRRDANDPDPVFPGEIGRFLATERLRAITDELHRHERVSRIAQGVPSVADARYEAWRTLASVVRERVSVVDVLHRGGCNLYFAGKNSRRNCDEFAGPCPICGGEDRLRAWDGPNGRFWCRQCQWSGDVIVAASLVPGNSQFRDALTFLSALAGVGVPS
jgi:hypothetical protein